MKKAVRYVSAIAIFLIVAATAIIPAFAFGTSIPAGDYVYYKYWSIGGSGNKYTEVRQRNRSYSSMVPGSATAMILTENDHKYELNSSVKFVCDVNLPTNISSVNDFYVKEKLMKKTGLLTWSPVRFSSGSQIHKVVSGVTLPRYTNYVYTYNAVPAETIYDENLGLNDFQIDLVCPYVEDYYTNYYTLYYQSGIFTM